MQNDRKSADRRDACRFTAQNDIPYWRGREITRQELQDAYAGRYRFNSERFSTVLRSCPDVDGDLVEFVLEGVRKFAAHEDGSIDCMRCGAVMGLMLRESKFNPDLLRLCKWVNNLDRLPMYKAEAPEQD